MLRRILGEKYIYYASKYNNEDANAITKSIEKVEFENTGFIEYKTFSASHMAILGNMESKDELLIENGIDIKSKYSSNNEVRPISLCDTNDTPKFWSLKNDEILIEKNIDIKSKNSSNNEVNPIVSYDINDMQKFLSLINDEIFEAGASSRSEEFIIQLLKKNNISTKELLNSAMVDNINNAHVVVGVLNIISHIDYNLLYPTGQTMAIAASRHEDHEVLEYSIRCFENWNSQDSLRILKTLRFEELWLNDYLKQVIKDMEEGV